MKHIKILAAAVALLAAASAQATLLDVKLTGSVQSQVNSGLSLNSAVTGEFIYDTVASTYTMFTIGGQSVAPGFTSAANISLDRYSAFYVAQVSPLSGGSFNSTFALDLEGINPFPTTDSAAGLLTDANQLAGNLDKTASTFNYYLANADGSGIKSLTASLSGISVTTAVPEPTTWVLMLAGIGMIGLRQARRRDA